MANFGESSDLVKCSFCGKSQQQVGKLIAGPGVYICNECVRLCNDIIEKEGIATQEAGRFRSSHAGRASSKAAGAGTRRSDASDLSVDPVALRLIQRQLSELSERLAVVVERSQPPDHP